MVDVCCCILFDQGWYILLYMYMITCNLKCFLRFECSFENQESSKHKHEIKYGSYGDLFIIYLTKVLCKIRRFTFGWDEFSV